MKKFTTVEVDTGYFLIVKADGTNYVIMPTEVHGVIRVDTEYKTQWLAALLSKELLKSGEIEALEREAISRTKEAVGEFSEECDEVRKMLKNPLAYSDESVEKKLEAFRKYLEEDIED